MGKSWLNLAQYKSSSRCPVNNQDQITLRLGLGGRGHIKYIGHNIILITRWYNVHNFGTMWYNICHIIQQNVYNIQELLIMVLPSAMTISMALHLPHIMFCLASQNKIEHTELLPSRVLVYYKEQYFPQT